MVQVEKDKKSNTWIITRTDNEGFHRQLNLTDDEVKDLIRYFNKINENYD